MLEPLLTPAFNRLLRANSWSLAKLRPHAGKTLALECPPLRLRVTIAENGELVSAKTDAASDTTIQMTLPVLVRAAARDAHAWNEAVVSGDVELAATVDYLRRHIVWDYEEGLSRIFGDIAAHRMAAGLRALDGWGRAAAVDVGRAFAEYAAYEAPIVASREAVEAFVDDVDEIRHAVERLEKRIARLKEPHAPA
jgi:ubiquinone biosynthesis protein UbiJ